MAAMIDARSLVENLTVDFALEGKKSCRDCLRSKAMPCEQVVAITKQFQIPESAILEAHSLVMQNLKEMSSQEALSVSSLSFINTAATAIRFAQLLLYLPSTKILKTKQDQLVSHLPESNVATSDVIDKEIHSFFENMVKSVLKVLEIDQSMDDDSDPMMLDASTTQGDVRPLMCFCFQSILRLHQFCNRKQQWMIPLTKALCDLATACHKRGVALPISLLEDAIRTMTKLLEEGTMILANHMTSFATTMPSRHHTFFAKFLSFLVARVITLVLLLPENYSDKDVPLSPLWKTLSTLWGMSELIPVTGMQKSTLNEPMAEFLKSFSEITSKMEKQMIKVLWRGPKSKGNAASIHLPFLQMFLEMKVKPIQTTFNNTTQWILRQSRLLGRRQVLNAAMKIATLDPKCQLTLAEIDVLLKICETYFSTVLPHCFGIHAASMFSSSTKVMPPSSNNLCLAASILWMAKLLIRIETTLSVQDANKRSQLHRLLIRWMSPSQTEHKMHPLTQEFVLSVIHVYLLSHGDTIPPLVSILIKVLFDSRTTTMLRSNIAFVLVRLQTSPYVEDWMPHVSRLIENEFVDIWKVYSASFGRRKDAERKRKRSNALPSIQAIHHYTSSDVEVIGQVLAHLSTHCSPLLKGTIEAMIDDRAWERIGEKKKAIHLKAISLLLWYAQGIMFSTTSSPALSDEKRVSLLCGLLKYSISQLTVNGTKKEKDFLDHYPLFIVTLSLCKRTKEYTMKELTVVGSSMCQFMAACTSKSFLEPVQPESMKEGNQLAVLKRRILLDGIALLGSIAPAITVSSSNQSLEIVREAFVRVFASYEMNILSPTLSALIKFGQTIASPHARSLPSFLPKDRIPLFQARGQGMIWKNGSHFGIDNSTDTFLELYSGLGHLVQQRNLEKSILPSLSSCHIAIGSYFLQMPTQGGRQAIVIFPPGEQSLKDIRHMYELQDDDEELTQVQSLKRIVVSKVEGEGCRFLLSK